MTRRLILVLVLATAAAAQTAIKNPTLTADPTADMQTATKRYVDARALPEASTYSGTPDQKLASCLADAAAGPGICTAYRLGNVSLADVLVIPAQTTLRKNSAHIWTVNVIGGVDAIAGGEGATLDCTSQGQVMTGAGGKIILGGSANVKSLLAPLHSDGTQEFMAVKGCVFQGNATATVSDSLVRVQGVFLNSVLRDNVFQWCYGPCVHVLPGTGANGGLKIISDVLFDNNSFNGGGTAGARPVVIETLAGSEVQAITFRGGAIEHAGPGMPLVTLDGKGISYGCHGIYFEQVAMETSASPAEAVKLTDCSDVTINAVNLTGEAGTSAITLAETVSGITHNIEVSHLRSPFYTNAIANAIDGETIATPANYTTAGYEFRGRRRQQRFGATTATDATAGALATTAYTWTVPFADANYTLTCTPYGAVNGVATFSTALKTATGFSVVTETIGAAAAYFAGVDCIAVHD